MPQKIVICGAGFLGSYIAKAIAASSTTKLPRHIQLTSRKPDSLYNKLQPGIGDGKMLSAVPADITKPDTLKSAFEGANVVVSLVGVLHGTPKMFEEIQWKGAGNVAQAAKFHGAKIIHFSAIGADESSHIPYARTKALGENAVREICSDATIIRPSLVFGPGDGFFARFATLSTFLPFMPVFGGGTTKFQPVYAGDIARAVEIASRSEDQAMKATSGKVFEAGGPDIFTYKEMMRLVLKYTGRRRPILSLPYAVGKMQGLVLEQLPPNVLTLTRDQVEQLKIDNIVNTSPPSDHASFAELLEKFGGGPRKTVDEVLPQYL
ncbi:NAD-binding protein [Fomitiporia mediterranea MF3/22]|uniref:NAD-binding protein n=1 Tax=Fomitiporia mediterranea (strain MF3/22) TaxID=694068 RepID=UPI0004408421|nr:NAD-binding protein [Fomitiporia mediterranea MF3/22]EJD03619.1 NAD-binding protein [Fomitiporia mediterranea MF3/22]